MRIRKKKWAEQELCAAPFFISDGEAMRSRWRAAYKNPDLPVHLELGCGKGGFIAALASADREHNFIAVDMIDSMLGLTKRAIESAYREAGREAENVLLTYSNAQQISKLISKEDGVERIYINFCNPWPKAGHRKRRLTHPRQLLQYREFLCGRGEIYFKTDDMPLFLHSLESFSECGFSVDYKTEDLHGSGFQGNIITEHERMFSEQGIPIKFCIVKVER